MFDILHSFFLNCWWFKEWPEEDYPPYANGPGYILSSDIAKSIVSEFESHKLRVSMICVCMKVMVVACLR